MSESKYITLEQLQKASQSLLVKINEQSNLKVDKAQVVPATTEGTLIGTIAGESFYVPAIDTSEFATWSSMDELTNNLSEVAWTGSYTDLSNLPAIPSRASDIGALPTTYTPPVTSVNGLTGAVVVSAFKSTSVQNSTEYDFIGVGLGGQDPKLVYDMGMATFAKYTGNYARITLGTATTPGVIKLYSSAKVDHYTELKALATTSNISILLPNESGTVALSSWIPTNVSELTNDANYATQSYVDSAVSSISVPTYSIAISSNRITLTSTAGDSSYIDLPVYDGTVEGEEE